MKKSLLKCCSILGEATQKAAALPSIVDPWEQWRATEKAVENLYRFLQRWDTVKRRPTFKRWCLSDPATGEKYAECCDLVSSAVQRLHLVNDGLVSIQEVERKVLEHLESAIDLTLEFVTLAKKKAGQKYRRK